MANEHRTLLAAALACLATALGAAPARAADGQGAYAADEARASLVVNFLRFVEWPASAFDDERAPVVICVGPRDPIVHPLARLARGRSVGGHALEVRRRLRGAAPSGCHASYLRASDEQEVAGILEYARRTGGLLTVAEIDGFADRGGMVEVTVESDRIRFTVNLASAERAGIRISSGVLSLGRVVLQPGW